MANRQVVVLIVVLAGVLLVLPCVLVLGLGGAAWLTYTVSGRSVSDQGIQAAPVAEPLPRTTVEKPEGPTAVPQGGPEREK
jgi:hypothetical protein